MRKSNVIKIKKIIAFSSIFSFTIQFLQGQNSEKYFNGDKFNVQIKTPDQAALSKFTDIPTTTHTGTQSIEIPLYSIAENGIELPITLKYHVSGVKISEAASRVGLGWALSIGGLYLNKQIFGEEDLTYPLAIPPDFNPNGNEAHNVIADKVIGFNRSRADASLEKHDTQPDIFSYSIPGASGDFFFNSSGRAMKLPQNDVKVVNNGTESFILLDTHGNKYFFSVSNLINVNPPRIFNKYRKTNYKIDKIEFSNNKAILFEYEKEYIFPYLLYSSYTKSITTKYSGPTGCSNSFEDSAIPSTVQNEQILKKIIFPSGTLELIYSDRQDAPHSKKVDRIIAKSNDKTVADYCFNYTYFDGDTDFPTISNLSSYESISSKLRLNSIINNSANQKFSFVYYGNGFLPHRFSYSTDYVGYWNGKGGPFPPVIIGNDNIGGDADKSPDINFAVQGALKSVIYPTGGRMDIEYENDDFWFDGIEPIAESKDMAVDNFTPEVIITPNSKFIYLDFNSTTSFNDDPTGDTQLPAEWNPYYVGELLDMNGILIQKMLINKIYKIEIPVPNVNYKIRIRASRGIVNPEERARLTASWTQVSYLSRQYNKSIGGLRVKSILKSEDNLSLIKQSYYYKDSFGKSTGRYIGDPLYYAYMIDYPTPEFLLSPWGECSATVVSNSGNINLVSANGKPIVYDQVTTVFEHQSDSLKEYKTIDYYLNMGIGNINMFDSPMLPFANNQFARGLLSKKEFYNHFGERVKILENEYDLDSNSSSGDPFTYISYFIFATAIGPKFIIGSNVFYGAKYGIRTYDLTSTWVKNIRTTITEVRHNKNIVTVFKNDYDSFQKHHNLLTETAISPDGSIKQKNYQYAHEKANQKLIDANMVGVPLETEVKKNGTIISKAETRYDDPAHLFPTSVKAYNMGKKDLSNELTYDRYDDKGNLLQYTTKAGISTAIIWGYNKTQPIAKIEGATYEQFSALALDIIAVSDADALQAPGNDETTLLGLLGTFRKNLTAHQVTTYTYDPLVGVRSITPPSGLREVYEYDSAGRLKSVKDHDDRQLKKYEYHYNTP